MALFKRTLFREVSSAVRTLDRLATNTEGLNQSKRQPREPSHDFQACSTETLPSSAEPGTTADSAGSGTASTTTRVLRRVKGTVFEY